MSLTIGGRKPINIYSEHALGILDEHDAGEHGTSSAGCPACTGWGDEQ